MLQSLCGLQTRSVWQCVPSICKRSSTAFSTFRAPSQVREIDEHARLGTAMVQAVRREGAFMLEVDEETCRRFSETLKYSRAFFARPMQSKTACVSDRSFSGYVAGGEELTHGVADRSEVFTVMPDIPASDARVQAGWPGHGPCPWPDRVMEKAVKDYMTKLNEHADRVLALIGLGLGMGLEDPLVTCTKDGWHHLRILRYPRRGEESPGGMTDRGAGAHTDYGLLVLIAQDRTGGLYVQKPSASQTTNAEWALVPPEPGKVVVIPGDMMQHWTDSDIRATTHEVRLGGEPRFSTAYFHEPRFDMHIPYPNRPESESVHYGTYITQKFLRSHPHSKASRYILAQSIV